MKKIGIDARLYNQTGVGTYLQNLLKELDDIAPKKIQFFIYLLPEDLSKISFKNKQFIKCAANFRWHTIKEQTGFLKQLMDDNLDLMHFTYFSYPILYPWRFIATVHDITPLLFKTGKASTKNPLFYNLKYLVYQYVLKNQVLNAKAIITPTNTVKNQIINQYGKKFKDKISFIYEGVNQKLIDAQENTLLAKKFNKPFFIYVGNFYPHKNVEMLIRAFYQTTINAFLVLVGPYDYFAQKLSLAINSNKDKRIFLHTTNNIGDIKFFYKHAQALIHPSLSEGFGLPLIEASYFNCPVIASDIPVFNELLGNQFIKFNPLNEDDLILKINNFYTQPVKFSLEQIVKKFSFKKMAKKTLDQYLKNL